MELFRDTNFDFLGKKNIFIALSVVLLVAGLASLVIKGGPRYGIDFRGGAQVYVKFAGKPPVNEIRTSIASKVPGDVSVQELTGDNELIIATELRTEAELETIRQTIFDTLEAQFGGAAGKPDLNTISSELLADRLAVPLTRNGVNLNDDDRKALALAIVTYRDGERSGILTGVGELSGVAGVNEGVRKTLEEEFSIGRFAIRQVEVVGPKVGEDLRRQAILATLYALGGMLVYIAFRFEWIYGVAAVIAVFHDVLITLGLFSIFDKEISLTVIAAFLTLVGYSMNDTIVIFDRMRENLKVTRREPFPDTINKSVNQTLSRTVMTSGLTFMTCLALFLFGGPVLNGFAFALVCGIVIGTYSSIFIASPILLFWKQAMEGRKGPAKPAKSRA
ncbi:MAG: protein translocase subunit SecF [Bryobacterales bacterium]|jgi:preprotein translocase subunit SecF|nr:protein translocase subunit SecF [Bryobacterales bacterium]